MLPGGCVWSIPVRPADCQVPSDAFGPFPCALGVVVLAFPHDLQVVSDVRVRSIHSGAPWVRERPRDPRGSTGALGSLLQAIEVVGADRVRWTGPFPFSLVGVRFVRVCSVQSRAP